jgi:dTDP-4-amino-4,6-dideoxy-D-galactose acyltransferase
MEPTPLGSRLDEVRARVAESLPWSPLDFLRGLSPAGDRAMMAESVLRPIDESNDLRFTQRLTPASEIAVCAERLPWDSAFFGYDVARLHGIFSIGGGYDADADYSPAVAALARLATSRGIRYLFGAVDARDLPTIRALTSAGFALIETRLYYHCPLRAYEYRRRFRCRLATAADVDGLVQLSRSIENPFDRFNSDPFIARADTLRLMETWMRASVLDGYADATLIPDTPNPGSVCTLKYHLDKSAAWGVSIGQIVLAMASPRAGNGLVGLVSELNYHLKALGMDHVYYTTQITNRGTARVGEHLGYGVGRGEYVFRLLL